MQGCPEEDDEIDEEDIFVEGAGLPFNGTPKTWVSK
jgi:hypothetical protein